MAGVERTQSPSDRRRTIRTLEASSIFNGGLIDQHDGNIIPDRIEAMTLQAAQAAAIGFQFQISPAGRANQYLQQFRTDRHSIEATILALSDMAVMAGNLQYSGA